MLELLLVLSILMVVGGLGYIIYFFAKDSKGQLVRWNCQICGEECTVPTSVMSESARALL